LTRRTSCHNSSGCSKRGDPAAADTSVGKVDVEPAPKTQRALDEVLHVVFRGGISLNRQRNAASLGDRRNRPGDRGRIAVCSQHARTFGGEQLRAGAADAAACTGYNRPLARQSQSWVWHRRIA
jgi:hypothetical protein